MKIPDLKSWVKQDQDIRNKYQKFVMDKWCGDYSAARLHWMLLHNTTDTDFFGIAKQEKLRHKKLLIMFNYIAWHSFSSTDWDNLWLLVQHADQVPALQKRVLSKLKQFSHVKRNSYHIRYLTDRLRINQSLPQRYHTQNNAWQTKLSPYLQRRWDHKR